MRIALFTEVFLPKIDGVVTRLTRTIESLDALGHEVLVFAPGDPPSHFAHQPVQRVRSIPLRPWYPELKLGLPTPSIARRMEEFAPHVVHLVNPVWLAAYGVLSAARRDLPMLASFHTNVLEYADSLGLGALRPGGQRWIRFLHNRAEVNLCTSPTMVDRAARLGIRRVDLWPKAVDTATYRPARADRAVREELTEGHPDDRLLLYAGRLSKEKQLDTLVAPLRRLQHDAATRGDPGVRLALVGSGPHRAELERAFAGTGTVFAGYRSGEALAAAYASADVFVFPSTTETLGLVALESMASGVPVVGARAGGIPDVIHDGVDGLLYEPGDDADFVTAVGGLLGDEGRRRAFAAAARAEAERYSWRAATERLVEFYDVAIDRHWRRRAQHPEPSLPMRLFGRPLPRPLDLP